MRVMSICRLCQKSLLFAGFIIIACLFYSGSVFADVLVPKPPLKPDDTIKVIQSAPLPMRKPVFQKQTFLKLAAATASEISETVSKRIIPSKGAVSDRQARLYKEIFELQEKGDLKKADKKIAKLENDLLMGHVLAQRYLHPTAYKASYDDLSLWLESYAGHPQAPTIHKLALSRKPLRSKKKLHAPVDQNNIAGNLGNVSKQGKLYKARKSRSKSEAKRVNKFFRDIRNHVSRNEPTHALNILSTDYAVRFIDDVEYDRLRAQIAAGYLFAGKLNQAMQLSQASLKRSGAYVPQAGWVKGLVHWQRQDYSESAQAFETAATSPYSSGWMISAAAYWASRAHMRADNMKLVSKWLKLSATYPRTFYGLIATRALGRDSDFDWSIPDLKRSHTKFVEKTTQGKRAAALIQIEKFGLAESELRNIDTGRSIKKREALLAYAYHHQLSALAMQLGNAFSNPRGGLYDAALYPVASWEPESGYRIDRALIHAIIRQESRFRETAQNPSGATGLMQLMPATANYIAGNSVYENKAGQHHLKNPEINLEIGQRYIEKLLNHKNVGQDLLSLTIAYNAGPGNLSRWKEEHSHIKDPLLFIETIPFDETRAFVERVLSNYWIYRMRLEQKTPSLDAVAEGKWARYMAQDKGIAELAAR